MNKQETRAFLKEKRKAIQSRKEKNSKILENLIALEEVIHARSIFCYLSTELEASTDKFISWCLSNRKTILVPKIINSEMIPVEIDSLERLHQVNSLGIREPQNFKEKEILSDDYLTSINIDVIILPALGFDKKGQRLGYGKGHYDKFLAKKEIASKSFKKIGLCFADLLLEELPVEDHDQGVHIIVSETGVTAALIS